MPGGTAVGPCREAQAELELLPDVDGVPPSFPFALSGLFKWMVRSCVCRCQLFVLGPREQNLPTYHVDLMVVLSISGFFVLFFVGVLLHTNGGLPACLFFFAHGIPSNYSFVVVPPPHQYRRRLPGLFCLRAG